MCSDFLEEAYLEVICKNLLKKGQNSALQGQKTAILALFLPFLQFFGLKNFFRERNFFIF